MTVWGMPVSVAEKVPTCPVCGKKCEVLISDRCLGCLADKRARDGK